MPSTEAQRDGALRQWAQMNPEEREAQLANARRGLQVNFIARRIEQIRERAAYLTDEHRKALLQLAQGEATDGPGK